MKCIALIKSKWFIRSIIFILVSVIIYFSGNYIWKVRGGLILYYQKIACSEKDILEYYFDIDLDDNSKIQQFALKPNKEFGSANSAMKPYILTACVEIDSDEIEKMDCYKNYIKEKAHSEDYIQARVYANHDWDFKEIDYYLECFESISYYEPSVGMWTMSGHKDIYVSEPIGNKRYIFLTYNKVGWNVDG